MRILKSFLSIVWEFIKAVFLLLVLFLILRYLLLQPFLIDGSSMEPNFHDKEYLLIEKASYHITAPKRGDVVIFRPPNNLESFYIKRIVGIPEDRVIIKDGRITILNSKHPNGAIMIESYLPKEQKTEKNLDILLNQGQFFVLGDNRNNSSDSREFGPVPRDNISGRAFFVVVPFSNFGFIERVKYPNLSFINSLERLSLLRH